MASKEELDVLYLLDEICNLRCRLVDWRESLVHAGTCTHFDNGPHRWEHDTGYGKQVEMLGRRCRACGFVDYYLNGKWVAEV